MEPDVKNQKPKKSLWTVIWESMTKTGGCCGSGGNCCGASRPDNDQQKKAAKPDAGNSCCDK